MSVTPMPTRYRPRGERGFNLIELMIAVAIIGILAAVAFPAYQDQVRRGNRTTAQAFLMDVAQREKQYLLDNRAYAYNFTDLNMTVPTDVSKHYNVTIAADPALPARPPNFRITATPTSGQQTPDGVIWLNSVGDRSPADKW